MSEDDYTPGRGGMGISSDPLDVTRCKKGVWDRERWANYSQCSRKAVLDGYCKQHHPDAEKLRQQASNDRWSKQMDQKAFGWSGPVLIEALRKIAGGNNDPRATALDALKRCGLSPTHDQGDNPDGR